MVLAPFFEKAPSLIIAPDGSVLFECICNANPQPTVKWFLKDKELTGDRYVSKIKKMVGKFTVTLHIKNPTQEDQGVYKVTATNTHGSHSVEQQYIYKCTGKEVFKTLD
ncbi:Ig-like domain-containing protein [Caenorhabditis elegans]|uniref:Ig-like domain-containing protein n=1 Tax=Caenorhabditis elegans TaxID=6239 RepID=Q9XWM1_CAEEL|nr:Ig-like domain-containing protein [Caenorhabditis elegans]CAA21634.1 Ig-like domain-containing protein [Caenorhabditis elegans]|eukprot:NP_496767.1 One IG domain [Caenorhabditis elegans]